MSRLRSHKPNLDRARTALIHAVEHAIPAVTLKELSLATGRNHAYLHQYLYQGTPRKLPEDVRQYLARTLNIDERLLVTNHGARSGDVTFKEQAHGYIPAGDGPRYGGRDLPIMGRSDEEDDRIVISGSHAGITERPSFLENVPDAFAVYVAIDSMKPRFKRGEMIYIDPSRPINAGDDVLIEFTDGRGTIKELVGRRKNRIYLRQYNPPQEFSVMASSVRRMSLIVGTRRA
jgi:Peptidase S24-like